MKIYAGIVVVAILLIAGILYLGSIYIPGYWRTDQFLQSIYVEALSFVVSTAIIGSLSAAVVKIMEESRAKPLRAYASGKIEGTLRTALLSLETFLSFADKANLKPFGGPFIATTFGRPHRYIRPKFYLVSKAYNKAQADLDVAISAIDKHAGVFPVEEQDDLSEILEALREAKKRIGVAGKKFSASYPDYYISMDGRTDDWKQVLRYVRSVLARYKPRVRGFEATQPSSESILIRSATMFAEDTRFAYACMMYSTENEEAGAPYHPDEVERGIANSWNIDIDFDEIATDEEAGVIARLPPGMMRVSHECVLTADSLIRAIAHRDVDLAANLLAGVLVYRYEKGLDPVDMQRWENLIGVDMGTWSPPAEWSES